MCSCSPFLVGSLGFLLVPVSLTILVSDISIDLIRSGLFFLSLDQHQQITMKFSTTAILIATAATASATSFSNNVLDRGVYEAKVSNKQSLQSTPRPTSPY